MAVTLKLAEEEIALSEVTDTQRYELTLWLDTRRTELGRVDHELVALGARNALLRIFPELGAHRKLILSASDDDAFRAVVEIMRSFPL